MPFALLSLFVLLWGLPRSKPRWAKPRHRRTRPVGGQFRIFIRRCFGRNRWSASRQRKMPSSILIGCRRRAPVASLPRLFAGLLLGLKPGRIFQILGRTLHRLRFAIIAMVLHAGAGICHAIFWNGCRVRAGFHANRLVVPLFQRIYRVAGSGADGQRHGVQCVVWRVAAHHRPAAEFESDLDVRHEQRRRRNGQNDRCAVNLSLRRRPRIKSATKDQFFGFCFGIPWRWQPSSASS